VSSRRASAWIGIVAGAAVGAAYPFIQLAIDCRAPQSEACVWGKSLLPLTLAVSVVVVGAIAAYAIYALLEWRRRSRDAEE